MIGMGMGAIIGLLFVGHAIPGMVLGMSAGALLGFCLDNQIRPRFLVAVIGLLGLGGLLAWCIPRFLA